MDDTPVRRCMGAVADAAVFIATVLASWWLVVDVIGVPALVARVMTFIPHVQGDDPAKEAQGVGLLALIVTALVMLTSLNWIPRYKTLIGKAAAPVARLVRSRFVGMGGSSSFGGLFNDWAHP